MPFTYGIGRPDGILIGTNIGGGQGGCALRTAWITLLLSALASPIISTESNFPEEIGPHPSEQISILLHAVDAAP